MNCNNLWKKELNRVTWLSWVIRMILVPVGIISSVLLSDMVLKAVNGNVRGNVRAVLVAGAELLGILLLSGALTAVLEVVFGRKSAAALHRCRLKLYETCLRLPLEVQYRLRAGETKEKLNDDFQTVAGRKLELYPAFWCSLFTAFLYLAFRFWQSPAVAGVLGLLSLIQVFPPVIVKRFMQVNYEETREIEAEITDFTNEGIEGFATIKLYHLKNWWLDKMAELNRRYQKIGGRSIYVTEAEITMKSFVSNLLRYGAYAVTGLLVLYQFTGLEAGVRAVALSGSLFGAVKTFFPPLWAWE